MVGSVVVIVLTFQKLLHLGGPPVRIPFRSLVACIHQNHREPWESGALEWLVGILPLMIVLHVPQQRF